MIVVEMDCGMRTVGMIVWEIGGLDVHYNVK
jgi:hypothetical protein